MILVSALTFVFIQKFFCSRKSHLVDVFVHFFGRHPHSFVNNGDGLILLIEPDLNVQLTDLALNVSYGREGFSFWVASTALLINSLRKISWSL